MSSANSPLRDRMVFLVGAPRSGTNWLQRMLAAHPDVVALPSETHLFSHGLRLLDAQVQHGLLTSPSTGTVYLPRDEWVAAMRGFCDLVYARAADAIKPGARLVVERTPQHVEYLPLIGEVFPDARVVHIIRDGRDVARSLARHEWGPGDVAAAAAQWSDSVRAARAAAPALGQYVEVRYEELMADPRARILELFGRLGLAADDAVLDAVGAAAGIVFNTDVTSPAIGVGKWRSEWRPADLRAFDDAAGVTLRDLGYPTLELTPAPRPSLPARVRHRLARRGSTPPAAPAGFEHNPVITSHEAAQILIDRFMAAAADGVLLPDLTDSARVHHAGPDGSWTAHGADGAQRLAAVLKDEGPWGRQLRGQEQLHERTAVVLTAHESADGSVVDRVVVLGLTPDNRLDHVGYLRFPVGAAGEADR